MVFCLFGGGECWWYFFVLFVFLGMGVGRVAVFCVYVFFVKKKKKNGIQ